MYLKDKKALEKLHSKFLKEKKKKKGRDIC
jgi:hypothetical protein